jgi:hypothetical protein
MIKIITKSGVELPYIKETLSIKDVNNAFVDSFNLTHTEFPFVILETPAVITELGASEINSFTSKKEIEITLVFGAKVYFGKLKILEYLENRRTCVLKFGNEFIKILDVNIADYMPTYYYGEEKPYTETVENWYDQEDFIAAIETDMAKEYPAIDYAAPSLNVGKFYTSTEWSEYQERFNQQFNGLLLNRRDAIIPGFSYAVKNFNSFVPMPYLMAMLKNPILNNGYKLAGTFVENPFNNKIIVVPNNADNNTAFSENKGISVSFNDAIIITDVYYLSFPFSMFGIGNHSIEFIIKGIKKPSQQAATLSVDRHFNGNTETENYFTKSDFEYNLNNYADYSGSVNFEVTEANIADSIIFVKFFQYDLILPNESEIVIKPEVAETVLHLIHPTVNLSRFVPDWTLGKLINNLKNFQNLNIDFDETTKTLFINYNEEFLKSYDYVDVSEEIIAITVKENAFKNKHNISYANDVDNVLINEGLFDLITASGNDDVIQIKNGFKILKPGVNSKDYLETEGVTLSLYTGGVYTALEYNLKTLALNGENGIVNTYWKRWINFRQNSKKIKAVAYLSALTISKIIKKKKIYFDNRMFAFSSFTTISKNNLNKVTLQLENIMPYKPNEISGGLINVLDPRLNIVAFSLEPNGFTSFIWQIIVQFNFIDFTTYNGTITAKQLIGDPGSSYSGYEFENNVSVISGQVSFNFPIVLGAQSGFYEIILNSGAFTSNIVFVNIAAAAANNAPKIIIAEVQQVGVIFYTKGIFTLEFQNFAASTVQVSLQKWNPSTQSAIGLPILSTISNVNLENYKIEFPESGNWRVNVVSGTEISNQLSWFSIQF